MNNIYFLSDTHFYHANIAGPSVSKWPSGYRDFSSVDEMNECLFDNINSMVKSNDTLFHIGDWSFGGQDKIGLAWNRINCKNIFLVQGNHDNTIAKRHEYRNMFKWFGRIWEGKLNGRYFFLNHFAQRVWEHSHHGSIHLFGHSHGTLEDDPHSLSMDVGVDTCLFGHKKYTPYHYDEVIHIMDNFKEWKPVDHHGPNTN